MKKLMILIAIAAMSATAAFANYTNNLDVGYHTYDEFRIVADEILASTNKEQVCDIQKITRFPQAIAKYKSLTNICEEVDEFLSKNGYDVIPRHWKSFPKTFEITRVKNNISTNTLQFIISFKYNVDCDHRLVNKCTVEEFIELFNFYLNEGKGIQIITYCKKRFHAKHALKLVKKMLYNQGKSFVTHDGINPCEEMMTRLTTSLNSARLSGFNDWLSAVGVKARINLDFLPTNEEIAKLKEDILSGQKKVTSDRLYILYLSLSSDDYNTFIKRYNGEQ